MIYVTCLTECLAHSETSLINICYDFRRSQFLSSKYAPSFYATDLHT